MIDSVESDTPRAMSRSARVVLSVLLTVVLVAIVWQFVDSDNLLQMLGAIRWSLVWIALGIFLLYQWLRALRLRLLIGTDSTVFEVFNTQCVHAFLNSTLPAGLGEVALIWLLRHRHGVRLHLGAAGVLIVRGMDLFLYAALFFVLLLVYRDAIPPEVVLVMVGLVVFLMLAVGAIRMLSAEHAGAAWLRKRFKGHIDSMLQAFAEAGRKAIWFRLGLYSLAMWIAMYVFFVLIINALGYQLSWTNVLWLYLLIFPINLLPIKGVANLGTHEAAWFISMQILGMDPGPAAVLAFGSHILFLVISCLTLAIPVMVYGLQGLASLFRVTPNTRE